MSWGKEKCGSCLTLITVRSQIVQSGSNHGVKSPGDTGRRVCVLNLARADRGVRGPGSLLHVCFQREVTALEFPHGSF